MDWTAKITVFSLGGGTFDISILELGEGVLEVKSTNRDTFLGGRILIQKIIDWIADEFKKDAGIDLRSDKMALQQMKKRRKRRSASFPHPLKPILTSLSLPPNALVPNILP